MRIRIIFISLLMLLGINAYAGNGRTVNYGLNFKSHLSNPEDRTGLDLSPDGALSFNDGLTMEFDVCFHRQTLAFGYIFRIFSGDASLDMLSNINSEKINFVFSDEFQTVWNLDFNDVLRLSDNEWYHVKIVIPGDKGFVSCSIDSVTKRAPAVDINLSDLRIRFGKNDNPDFFTTDVPPISVKNIKLLEGGKLKYHWMLARHANNYVFDEVEKKRAKVENGEWVMDAHLIWEKVLSLGCRELPMVAYDGKTSRLFVSELDSMFIFHLDGDAPMTSMKVDGTPIRNAVNQIFYDPSGNRLLSYSMHDNRLTEFDFDANKWTKRIDEIWPPLTGHGKYFDSASGKLYLFGGYGNHLYNADFTVLDINSGERTTTDLSDAISPRYFGSFCHGDDGSFYVLGGYGSKSGHQEEFPKEMNDIFKIDVDSMTCTKIGEFSLGQEPMMFSSSMIFDKQREIFFTLSFNNAKFNTAFNLVSTSHETDTLVKYANPVSFSFHDTDSFIDLVFSKDSSLLYAIVANSRQNGINRLDVWSLAVPPISRDEVMSEANSQNERNNLLLYIAGSLLCLAVVMSYISLRRRRQKGEKKVEKESASASTEEIKPELPDIDDEKQDGYSIIFLGCFKIFNKNREDVTSRFSSKMRSIFQYLIFRTAATGETTTTDEISDIFWFGMDRADSTNSRNVYFTKIRSALQDVGDFSLTVNKELVSLRLGEDVTCDYIKALSLLNSLNTEDVIDLNQLAEVLSIVSAGSLLPGYEFEWIDKFKATYSELLISVMMKAAGDDRLSKNYGYLSKIADIILREDSLDEFAIKLKCRTLYNEGHKGKAQALFDKWHAEYKKVMNADPDISYTKDILESDGA